MKNHPNTLNVQLAASACVFNLTKQDLAFGMPIRLLGQVTQLLLEAMKTFPNHQQVRSDAGIISRLFAVNDAFMSEIPSIDPPGQII